MNYKILFYILFVILLFERSTFSDEINFNSTDIKVLEKGNIVTALNVEAYIPNKKIKIEGDKSIYNKKNSKLTIINNVKFEDNFQNIYIEGQKIIYDQSKDILQTFGKTFIRVEDKYYVYSEDLFYNRKYESFLYFSFYIFHILYLFLLWLHLLIEWLFLYYHK